MRSSLQSEKVVKSLSTAKVLTVCQSARCPNISECFDSKSIAILVMGEGCTRGCVFCSISSGSVAILDPIESFKVHKLIEEMNMNSTVITSVNRDEIFDGGAYHFLRCVLEAQRHKAEMGFEILIPDFKHHTKFVSSCFKIAPVKTLNHNVEVIPRLYSHVKIGGEYINSFLLLHQIKTFTVKVKTGLMVGFGESFGEVLSVLREVSEVTELLTIGHYLPPLTGHEDPDELLHPNIFKIYEGLSVEFRFLWAMVNVMARSSFKRILS
jgi:lipoic acid synthetase